MTFLNLQFFLFLPIVLFIYFLTPAKYRYLVIFFGSYYFYGYSNHKLILLIGCITLLTYLNGFIIERFKNKLSLILSFIIHLSILIFYKYFSATLPIGLSFVIFQSCTYLTDIYKGNIPVEKNFCRFGAFIAFFPTVLSGPIQKARILLPQLKSPKEFTYEAAEKGTLLFLWGVFEKIMVANKLSAISTLIYNDYLSYNSAYYIIAAICFSFYIYADFSSYSDMARGIAQIMGIQISKNFDNPYLSTTTAEFWRRWHISLNDWFVENVYIPLGGGRKGLVRKYLNIFIVFLLSGIWHGKENHFIFWGIVNGLLVIAGHITKPIREKFYRLFHFNKSSTNAIWWKRTVVFWLITLTWIPFKNGIKESLYIIQKILLFHPINFFDQNLFVIGGSTAATFICILCTIFFCKIQFRRQNELTLYEHFSTFSFIRKCFSLAILICICIFGALSTGTEVNSQFMYFQF